MIIRMLQEKTINTKYETVLIMEKKEKMEKEKNFNTSSEPFHKLLIERKNK